MSLGQKWKAEATFYKDPDTGVDMIRFTSYKGNHGHLYFTNPGWYDNGKKIVFTGDRDNRANLFSLDLETYEITQITDLEEYPLPYEHVLYTTAVDPIRNRAYLAYGRDIVSVDLMTYEMKTLYTIPEGFCKHVVSCGEDADYVYTSIYQDFSDRFPIDIERGYIGFKEIFLNKPESHIVQIRTDGTGYKIIRTENCWIGHVNASPKRDTLISFCHEGPWDLVDHRIWTMDTETGEVWKLRPVAPGERIGHEYWHDDGIHIGYHGHASDGINKFFGCLRYDGTEATEVAFNFHTGHIHSQDSSLIVGDGNSEGKYIRLWKWDGEKYIGPKALCGHFSTFKTQRDHAHPRFSPDGKYVIFASDIKGYTSMYYAKVPDFDSLPDVTEFVEK